MNRQFSVNLKGLIKNFNFPEEPLFPVCEAIINAIQSIAARRKEDSRFKNGIIKIKLIREGIMPPGVTNDETLPIYSFEITDNGIGFKEDNMKLFMESGSTSKENLGCRGIGRFSWIKFFKKVEIESVYFDKKTYVKREFEFTAEQPAINDTLRKLQGKRHSNSTTIRLIDYIDSYAPYIELVRKIVLGIIEYCLAYFVSDDCPQIYLIDGGKNNTFNLNQIFKDEFKEKSITHIEIGKASGKSKKSQKQKNQAAFFRLVSVKVQSDKLMTHGHKLYLCAHNRIVKDVDLSKYIINLDSEFYQKNKFWYTGILSGEYLDDNVDIDRLSFTIPEKDDMRNLLGDITMEQIIRAAYFEVKKILKSYFTPIADKEELTRKYWKYYLMLEKRFIESTEYVELSESNFETFSNAYVALLLAIGAEIDMFFKEFCMFDTSGKMTIKEYAEYIGTHLSVDWEIELKESGIKIYPFRYWRLIVAPGKSLEWWAAYTGVKHNRFEQLPLANQKNVLHILGALFLLETLYLIRITKGTSESEYTFDEPSKLFTVEKLPIKYIRGEA